MSIEVFELQSILVNIHVISAVLENQYVCTLIQLKIPNEKYQLCIKSKEIQIPQRWSCIYQTVFKILFIVLYGNQRQI